MTESAADTSDFLRSAQDALSRGDASRARALLEHVIAAGVANVETWVALAHAAHLQGDTELKGKAIDQALALAPKDIRVLIAKADHLAERGDSRAAAAFYSSALQYAPTPDRTPPRMREALERARMATAGIARELEDFVRSSLAASGVGGSDAPARFSRSVDILFGRKRAYVQQPRYLYYPELPNVQFYEREQCSWLDAVEDSAVAVLADLNAMLGPAFTPYLTQAPGRPRNDQMGLVDDPSWSALFLHKDGVAQPAAASCIRTIDALAEAPLTRIPGRAPSILFSKLAAGARIPPHTGMLNTRLICHLPLIVPEDCVFRVGNEERAWEVGKAWAFDDTIEHEAWNGSTQDRYILIFDVWRPELSLEERACVSALCQAIDAYRSDVSWDG